MADAPHSSSSLIELISRLLREAKEQDHPDHELVQTLLKAWAREQDQVVEQGLLRDLVMRYAQNERALAEANELLAVKTRQLGAANRELERLTNQDGLTGIANRRYLDAFLEREYRRCARAGAPVAVVLADVDHFKDYNDAYGHQAGDHCLKMVARVLAASAKRPGDLAARYGGEEFVLALPDTQAKGAVHIAEEARRAVRDLALPHRASSAAEVVTLSLGVAVRPARPDGGPEELLALADKALYAAKSAGRDRVQAAP